MENNNFFSVEFANNLRTTLSRLLDENQAVSNARLCEAMNLNQDDAGLVRLAVHKLCPDVISKLGKGGGWQKKVA